MRIVAVITVDIVKVDPHLYTRAELDNNDMTTVCFLQLIKKVVYSKLNHVFVPCLPVPAGALHDTSIV